jgi:mitochondrial distribution and morphology protein 10
MFSLQHDVGKWCTEYSWSAEDSMWGVRVLHNFGRRTSSPEFIDEGDKGQQAEQPRLKGLKRVDEEEAMEGGLKGRFSAGAELYVSAKERSAGG